MLLEAIQISSIYPFTYFETASAYSIKMATIHDVIYLWYGDSILAVHTGTNLSPVTALNNAPAASSVLIVLVKSLGIPLHGFT